jgi:hypothetical protein
MEAQLVTAPQNTSSATANGARAHTLGPEIATFIHNIDALQTTLPVLSVMATALVIACEKQLGEFLEKYGQEASSDDLGKTYKLPSEHQWEYRRLSARRVKASAGTRLLPQTYVVALVSQYDAFLGGLLRCLYRAKPELLKQSERQLSYSQLAEFGDLEQAKESILEKEIEAVLRMSHPEQFDFMEKRFSVPLRKDLPIWPTFIEVTERRNLFVHCNGKVSAQYLIVCDRHGAKYDGTRPAIGELLGVTSEYFARAYACVLEIGAKLGHVLWRKILPNQRDAADQSLNMLIYDLLVAGDYETAAIMGDFSIRILKDHSSDHIKRMMVVNTAQAYKWKGDDRAAKKIVNDHDWSSSSDEFKLAATVLMDDFARAAAIMKKIGPSGAVGKNDYRDWPLFKNFRKSSEFDGAYKDIFGHSLEPLEVTPVDDLFHSLADLGPGNVQVLIKKK